MGWYPGHAQVLLNRAHAVSPSSAPSFSTCNPQWLPTVLETRPMFFLRDLISSTLPLLATRQLLVLEGPSIVPPQGLCICGSFHLERFPPTFPWWTPHLHAPSSKKPSPLSHPLVVPSSHHPALWSC